MPDATKSRMKRSILAMAIIGCLSCMMAGTASSSGFQGNVALAKEILRIVDENGLPVVGAIIHGGLQTGGGINDFVPINGITSSNGEYVIEGECANRIRCDVKKELWKPRDKMGKLPRRAEMI